MRVTFDTNAWQRVVRPEAFAKDPRLLQFKLINTALRERRISGFISETVGTLEGIKRVDRGVYFAARRPKVSVREQALPDGRIKVEVQIGPDNDQHPGLAPILSDFLTEALELGVRLMSAPRVGQPRPPDFLDESGGLNNAIFAEEREAEVGVRLDRFADVSREIEQQGLGRAIALGVSKRIQDRSGGEPRPWFEYLDGPRDAAEAAEIAKAIAEWADGDTVACHVAYKHDLLCTEDAGKSAGKSILSSAGRSWLAEHYGVNLIDLEGLASTLDA